MQKMKNGLMMFCLTVLLSCAALMMNTPTASAMTLNDLQGTYRIQPNDFVSFSACVVDIRLEKGELIGRITKATRRSELEVGTIFMEDFYVQNGQVHCNVLVDGYKDYRVTAKVDIYNNGAILDVIRDYGSYRLERI